MYCLTTIFLVFGSRITILVWWLRDQEYERVLREYSECRNRATIEIVAQ
jgi:hypothetical protein